VQLRKFARFHATVPESVAKRLAIEREQTATRMRLRHLTILVVYVAVAVAVLVSTLRTTGPERLQEVISTVVFVPIALLGLSALILRPGPHRVWLAAFFLTSSYALLASFLTAPALLVSVLGRRLPKPGELFLLAVLLFCGCLTWIGVVALVRWRLIPSQCPRCGRKTLRNATLHGGLGRTFQGGVYVRCGVCDRESFVSRSQYAQGCSSCGRHTLRYRRYTFAWCLSCHARYKRAPRAAWEIAADPSDESFLWLWSFGEWLRSLIDRMAKKADPRN
jgi:hypothetical protein